jgi:hypothetical protein
VIWNTRTSKPQIKRTCGIRSCVSVAGNEAGDGVDELLGLLTGGPVHVDGVHVEVEGVAHGAVDQHLHLLARRAQRLAVLDVGVVDEVCWDRPSALGGIDRRLLRSARTLNLTQQTEEEDEQ